MLRASIVCVLAAAGLAAQDAAALKQRVAEVRQALAQNQQQLRQYKWTETTELSLKGEVKKRSQKECHYGPDGKVVKVPIGAPEAAAPKRGLKGKMVAKKTDELDDYMDRVGSLVSRYVPPDGQAMQAAFQAGKATLGQGTLAFSGYAKPGDKLTITVDPATKKMRAFSMASYLDKPDETVTLEARFSALGDGTSYVEEWVLNAAAKQIQIKTTNFGHQK
jgi:Tfp pilus assembly protein PilE